MSSDDKDESLDDVEIEEKEKQTDQFKPPMDPPFLLDDDEFE